MLKRSIIIAGFALMAVGCSTISKDSCIAGSWESLGYQDGREGESRGQFNKIAKSCAKYGISANAVDYRLGYEAGIGQYCSYDKGYAHGTSGYSIKAECREIKSTPYLDGYAQGLPLYCSFDRGFDHGDSGKSVNGKCLKIQAIPYLEGHEEGAILYTIRQDYEGLIDLYEDKLGSLEDVVYRLSNLDMDDKTRTRLRKKKRRLEREVDDTRIDIRAFERIQNWPKRSLLMPDFDKRP